MRVLKVSLFAYRNCAARSDRLGCKDIKNDAGTKRKGRASANHENRRAGDHGADIYGV